MNNKAKTQLQAIISKMTFSQALCMSKGLKADYDVAGKALEVFPRGAFGMIPADVKSTLEFKTAQGGISSNARRKKSEKLHNCAIKRWIVQNCHQYQKAEK